MSTFEHDLTKGNIWKQLVWFAVPFFISNLIQSLYSLIDLIILGHFGGTNSISAANIGGQVLVILTNLAAGLSGGGTVMLGNYLGSKRKDKINGAISTLLITLTVMAAVFMVLLFILKQPLLRLLDTPEEAFSQAEQYLFICTLGLLFIYGYNALSAIMRGLGDSRTPMIFVMIACVINIILDPVFIFVFDLGVSGAAIATVLSQAVGAIWILRFLSGKKTILHLRKENFKLQKNIILPCLGLGISTFVMLSTESILSISFTSSLSRYGGDLAVGAMTIITSVSQLATLPLQGICQGGQPITRINFGAGNKERVKKSFFTQFTVCTVFTGCFWLIMLLFPRLFAGIFSNDTDLIAYTAWALRIYMAGIFSLGFQVSCQQSFMALGQAKVSLLLACLRKLILLIPLIFILPLFIQNKVFAVFLAEPISDILAAIITTSTFFRRFDKILDRR